eukprot:NODE_939_length_2915_cov_0.365412.p2 type:complete len:205 gc:universal NODE_939_length_2915_cov_0.365412:1418-2032(+)
MLQLIIYKFIQFLYFVYRLLPFAPSGKVFLITGATKGIGRELAVRLASKGKTLVLTGRNEDLLKQVKEEIYAKYNTIVYTISFDVSKFDDYSQFFERVNHMAGPVDTIVLNAGISGGHPVGSKGAFDRDLDMLETNLLGPISCVNVFVNYAKQHHIKDPHVVVISSVAGDIARPLKGAYSASKSALNQFIEACALELESEGTFQ